MKHHAIRHQTGLTLIEVLVAILIFSFGLLGFVGLQARAIQFSVGAEDSNRAALLANDMASTMVATKTVDTTDTNLAAALVTWQARVSDPSGAGLPSGTASAVTNANSATLTITWRATGASAGAANSTNQYVTTVVLP